jgi:hypothetical protein
VFVHAEMKSDVKGQVAPLTIQDVRRTFWLHHSWKEHLAYPIELHNLELLTDESDRTLFYLLE